MKQNNKNNVKNVIIVLLVMLLIITALITLGKTSKLTQLQNNSSRQMMGYIIKTDNNKIIVIDGGLKEDAPNLLSKIEQEGGQVEAWFLTHPHMDHIEAFQEIVKTSDIKMNNIYTTLNELSWYEEYEKDRIPEIKEFFETLETDKIKNNIHEVSLNEEIKIDNIKCEILGIKNPEITNNPINNSSMVIKMKVHNKSIIFLADTGVESGQKLLKNQKEKLKADILQMAHHGQGGAEKEVYEQINPKICLWPTTDWLWDNDPGTGYNTGIWTTIETRNWMEELKVTRNYIEKDGDITINI